MWTGCPSTVARQSLSYTVRITTMAGRGASTETTADCGPVLRYAADPAPAGTVAVDGSNAGRPSTIARSAERNPGSRIAVRAASEEPATNQDVARLALGVSPANP